MNSDTVVKIIAGIIFITIVFTLGYSVKNVLDNNKRIKALEQTKEIVNE